MRKENWPVLLNERIDHYRNHAVAYGSMDCWLFCAQIIDAMTGKELAADAKGYYTTLRGGLRRAKKLYGATKLEDIPAHFFPEMPVKQASRGDVVFYDGCLGICNGKYSHFLGESGLVVVPTINCQKAWRVE